MVSRLHVLQAYGQAVGRAFVLGADQIRLGAITGRIVNAKLEDTATWMEELVMAVQQDTTAQVKG